MTSLRCGFKIIVACIPAAVVGLLLDDWLNEHFYNSIVVAVMLILVGAAFIFIENRNRDRRARVTSLSQISYLDAILIGVFSSSQQFFRGHPVRERPLSEDF